jgi:hypothetical protein
MEFSPDDAPISEADLSFTLHLAPSSAAILFFQARKLVDAFADGDGLNIRNLFQYIKIRHSAPIGKYSPQPTKDLEDQSARAVLRLSALIGKISCIFSNGLPQFLTTKAYVTSAFHHLAALPAWRTIIVQDSQMQFEILTHF